MRSARLRHDLSCLSTPARMWDRACGLPCSRTLRSAHPSPRRTPLPDTRSSPQRVWRSLCLPSSCLCPFRCMCIGRSSKLVPCPGMRKAGADAPRIRRLALALIYVVPGSEITRAMHECTGERTGERRAHVIGLLQRVSHARVAVAGDTVGAIGQGLLVLVCAERGDKTAQADRLLDRLLGYRVFADGAGKMNLSVRQVQGGLLLIPQFTLAADTTGGNRPSFSPAAPPEEARMLFD